MRSGEAEVLKMHGPVAVLAGTAFSSERRRAIARRTEPLEYRCDGEVEVTVGVRIGESVPEAAGRHLFTQQGGAARTVEGRLSRGIGLSGSTIPRLPSRKVSHWMGGRS